VKQLIISSDPRETRVAILEQGRLAELFIERRDQHSMVGNIYKGRVENVLPGMDAAFVDIGLERNGFLYVDEVGTPEDADARPRKIGQLLKAGQELTVQVLKDPLRSKGPRLTTQLSIAGRYLVYVPEGRVCGVSRRLPDEERQRLRALCRDFKPENAGVIIRTAAEGVSDKAIVRDLRFLEKLWGMVQTRLEEQAPLTMVYAEAELAVRIVRDLFTEDFTQVLVDDEVLLKRIRGFLEATTPELVERVELYQGTKPIFQTYGIEGEIERALQRRVDLPSGGYLVIDHTEALTVIDVNTGRYVGRKFLEDTILRANLEACREVVRQLRVRDIGGIIIIDFIDMTHKENREQVLSALQAELAHDRTKTYVVELSPLGLVEMTRQNVTEGIRGVMTEACPTCAGEGVVLAAETLAIEAERRIRRLVEREAAEAFLVEVHPRVAAALLAEEGARLRRLEAVTGKRLRLESVPQVEPQAVRIAGEGVKDLIDRAALPVVVGTQREVWIEEPHAYDPRDGVARVDGYPVCVRRAAGLVGQTAVVVIEEADRFCARARLVGEPS